MRLSYLVTTYGRAELAERAVSECLRDAALCDGEVLLMDDHSPGQGFAKLKARFKGARRARLVRNPRNLGLVGNWNRGLRLAKASHVVILGDDDSVLPGFGQALLKAMASAKTLMASCAIEVVGLDGRRRHLTRPLGRRDRVLSGAEFWSWCVYYFTPIALCATVFDRKALLRSGGMRAKAWHAADGDAYLRLSRAGLAYVAAPLARQGYHAGQLHHGMRGDAMAKALAFIAASQSAPPGLKPAKGWKLSLAAFLRERDLISTALSSPPGAERDAMLRALGAPAPELPARARVAALLSRGALGAPARLALRLGRAARRRWGFLARDPRECHAIMRGLLEA